MSSLLAKDLSQSYTSEHSWFVYISEVSLSVDMNETEFETLGEECNILIFIGTKGRGNYCFTSGPVECIWN
jgi:hypothetical protein